VSGTRPDLAILDFDGTITDVEREAAAFLPLYLAELERLLGQPLEEPWAECAGRIEREPGRHGVRVGGAVMAAAEADPYCRCYAITQLVAARIGFPGGERELLRLALRAYGVAYEGAARALTGQDTFRVEARVLLAQLATARIPAWIVTNAGVAPVREKLERLAPSVLARVRMAGDARKFDLCGTSRPDARFDALPREARVPGMDRGVQLRRGAYFEVLADVFTAAGVAPERALVVGDVYEMDLSLPAALGARVHLVTRPSTPAHERRAIEALGARASASPELEV
jgi:phosphoglycolate phosphatase-like HAD superfamily hydrolase